MAFKPGQLNQPDLARLRAVLNTSLVRTKDNPLFQTVNELLDQVEDIQEIINANVEGNTSDISVLQAALAALTTLVELLQNLSYLTENNDSVLLPNSRQLLAGLNVNFNDSIPNERTIDVIIPPSAGGSANIVMSGFPLDPVLVTDSFGRVVLS